MLDEKGRFAVSLLSGHLGGANKIAKEIAGFLSGQAVITTASDTNNLPAIDLWAKENDLAIENWDTVPEISTRFLNSGELRVYSEVEMKMPEGFLRVDKPSSADVLITNKQFKIKIQNSKIKFISAPRISLSASAVTEGHQQMRLKMLSKEHWLKKLSFLSIHSVATIDIKADEKGLNEFVREYGFPIKTFTANELNTLNAIQNQR